MSSNPLLESLDTPEKLEQFYHDHPRTFGSQLDEALLEHPHSQLLQFWRSRLEFQKSRSQAIADSPNELPRLLLLCLSAILLIKLPLLFPIAESWFYPRFAPFIVIGSLLVYFTLRQPPALPEARIILGAVAAVLVTMALLPDDQTSSSIIMATLHAPLVMWSALGLTFAAANWRDSGARLNYLRYNGELFIYTVLILLGGFVLSGMTLGLFSLLNLDIQQWYFNNVVVAGLVCAPLVASFLYDIVLRRQSRLATLIANVFTPLFLVMITLYLLAMLLQQQSPFTDRNFLILFNGLLLLVLAMTIFSIAGRNTLRPSKLADCVNLGLISVTLLVNVVALSAIIYRLAEWGLSPNRVVVTGANLLVFVHLIVIISAYIKLLRGRCEPEALTGAATGMLPIYGLWSLSVMLGLPLLFQFQ